MKNRNLLMRVKTYTSNLFFYGCRWCMLITAYALVAILIVMSSENYFSEGVYAAEVAYATEAYDFSEPDEVFCMSVAQPEKLEKETPSTVVTAKQIQSLNRMAVKENYALAAMSAKVLAPSERINVNIIDSVANDKTVQLKKQVKDDTAKKKVSKESQEAFGRRNHSKAKIQLSSTDRNVLLRIVEAEATGEDVKGKMLVANVVLNRVKSGKFPDTVEKVVFQKNGSVYQFSPIKDGRYYKVSVSTETKRAVDRVLNGEDESKGALYFMSRGRAKASSVTWFDRALTRVFKYGTHEFYK